MKPQTPAAGRGGPEGEPVSPKLDLAGLIVGTFLAIGLLKFGNPVVLDRMVEKPSDLVGVIFQPWPVMWGYYLLPLISAAVFWLSRKQLSRPRFWALPPALWLIWEILAHCFSSYPELSKPVLVHFGFTALFFYLGYLCFGRRDSWTSISLPLLLGFGWVIWMGMDQHFGGLAATREEFYKQHPDFQKFPAEFIKKINSDRIFSTLVYPNALAGAILLLLPPLTLFIWDLLASRRRLFALVGVGGLVYGGISCLVWSGSKAGWLLALLVASAWGMRQKIPARLKYVSIIAFLGIGTLIFTIKYQSYFTRGATSVGARFDYWKAGIQNTASHPIFGTGPGTFASIYARLKTPESEMARLTHNDYLQQASDSGLPGMILYFLIFPAMIWRLRKQFAVDSLENWVWLGLFGWTLQSVVEFGLYIPALSWIAFFWMGALLRRSELLHTHDSVS